MPAENTNKSSAGGVRHGHKRFLVVIERHAGHCIIYANTELHMISIVTERTKNEAQQTMPNNVDGAIDTDRPDDPNNAQQK